MTWPILIVLVLMIIAAALIPSAKRRKRRAKPEGAWPYYAKKPLTPPEQVLYFRLRNALPDRIVLAQVQYSRMLGVKKGFNFNEWNNRINRSSADFVICEKDASILAVIELDDATHQRQDRQEADAKKNKALGAAAIPIFRWQAKSIPNEAAIRGAFASLAARKPD